MDPVTGQPNRLLVKKNVFFAGGRSNHTWFDPIAGGPNHYQCKKKKLKFSSLPDGGRIIRVPLGLSTCKTRRD